MKLELLEDIGKVFTEDLAEVAVILGTVVRNLMIFLRLFIERRSFYGFSAFCKKNVIMVKEQSIICK